MSCVTCLWGWKDGRGGDRGLIYGVGGRLGEMRKFVCDDVYLIDRSEVVGGNQLWASV